MIPALVACTLFFLAALHVYWALGGSLGRDVAIPEVGGRPAFAPTARLTFVVAFGLFVASLVALLDMMQQAMARVRDNS